MNDDQRGRVLDIVQGVVAVVVIVLSLVMAFVAFAS